MPDFKQRYITVSMDINPDGFSFQAWWSSERPHAIDLMSYPHIYTYMSDTCTWFIYCNNELTPKMIQMCGEQADAICVRAQKINQNRKVSNL